MAIPAKNAVARAFYQHEIGDHVRIEVGPHELIPIGTKLAPLDSAVTLKARSTEVPAARKRGGSLQLQGGPHDSPLRQRQHSAIPGGSH
jgi:hypothetical protein